MYSSPLSVSKMYLLSSLEKETRGSASNSAGSCGKLGALGSGAGGSFMITQSELVKGGERFSANK